MPDVSARPTVVHGTTRLRPGPITAERYVSASWLARELTDLWPRVWMFAGLERDVDQPGRYLVLEIGRESIVVSRGPDGEVAAHYNVCRHRGARILTESHGCEQHYTCPYHGWSYRPDGRLVVVPDNNRFPGGVDRAQHSLVPLRVGTALGMVWVCMDDAAPPLADYLGPLVEILAPYQLETMTLVEDQTVTLGCNWKTVFDNFQELYHVEHIHPQHELLFDCPTAQIHLFEHGHTGVVIDGHTVNSRKPIPDEPNVYQRRQLAMFGADPADYVGRVLDIRADVQRLRREAGPSLGFEYEALTDERLTDIEQYNVFPNTMLTVQPDDAIVMRARPHPTDPDRCFWDKLTFRRQPDPEVARRHGVELRPGDPSDLGVIPRPEHDEFTEDDIIAGRKTMTITIDQDVHYLRDVQAGMHSRGFTAQKLCDDEVRIQHFHDWLDHWMGIQPTT